MKHQRRVGVSSGYPLLWDREKFTELRSRLTIDEICAQLKVSYTAANNAVRRFGLSRGYTKPTEWDDKALLDAYLAQGKSAVEIAKEHKVESSSVYRALERLGVPRRHSHKKDASSSKAERTPPTEGQKRPRDQYVEIYTNGRWQLEHRVVMQRAVNRILLPTEHVHHINGIGNDNRLENLRLLSRADHTTYTELCRNCELRKEIRLLHWQIKQLTEALQLKLGME